MSASAPKADTLTGSTDVRLVPLTDIGRALFAHLVGVGDCCHLSFPPSPSAAPVPHQDSVPYGATSLAISAQPEPRRCAIESECAAPRLTRNITAAGHCLADRAECDGTNKAQVLSP